MRDQRRLIVPFAALGITILFLLLPVRTMIKKCCRNEDDSDKDNTTYEKIFSRFPTDYDRENPVTKNEGFLRLINQKIKEAENDE